MSDAAKLSKFPSVISGRMSAVSVTRDGSWLAVLSHVRWQHLAAGVSGGVISTLVLHPLDLIKIRFQVNEGQIVATQRPQYTGLLKAAASIFRQSGIRGLYQGVTPNVWGAGASWGLYFLGYNALKAHRQNGDTDIALSAPAHMIAAAEAGLFTLLLTNPIWVAKTRLCLQYDSTVAASRISSSDPKHYRGMFDCLYKTYKFEGFRGLYKGFVPGVFGVSHGALQFMAYEELKKIYNDYYNQMPNTKLGTVEYLCFAALSKIFAATTTYPYQVIRARLQDQHRHYSGAIDVIQQTFRNEGVKGFYKGLIPGVLRVTPACCITFVVYEHVVVFLMNGSYFTNSVPQPPYTRT
jgi:solute carrier family 25 folate transporter 32